MGNLTDLTAAEEIQGAGYSGGLSALNLKSIIRELQKQTFSLVTGVAGDGSVAVTNLSAGRGDTLLYVFAFPSAAGLAVNVTGSSSISADRILIASPANTEDKKMMVCHYPKT